MRAIKFIRRHFDFSPIVWLLLIATGISLGLVVRQASANHQGACPYRYNRCQFHGYYTDAAYNPGTGGQYFFSSGVASGDGGMPVYNVDQFVDYIRIRLNASTNYTDGYGTVRVPQDNVGAATIVNTMLEHNGTDFGNNRATGIQNAKNRFAEWESRVRYYDSVGAVTWNYNNVYFPDGEANSLYHPAANDNDFYNTPITDNQNAIMFWSLDVDEAAGTYGPAIYQIKKNCGNPIGVLRGLQTPPVIQGVVYKVDSSGNNLGGVTGARIETCQGQITSDANGWFQKNSWINDGFCVRVASGGPSSAEYDGPFIRPWSEGYGSQPGCTSGYGGPPYSGYCSQQTYEYQAAGTNAGNGYDRNWDGGYDIVYVQKNNGSILGRVFIDTNGNGAWESGERFVQNGVNCGSGNTTLGATVNISGVGNSPPNKCNPDPFYETFVAPGSYTVSMNPPSGYSATTGAQTCSVPLGSQCHKWFGIRISDSPPTITVTPSCSSQNFVISASDPDGSNFNLRYRIDGGSWTTRAYSGTPIPVNMSSYNQYDRHTIDADTSGAPPSGGSVSQSASITAVYGIGANRACIDRDFTTVPTAASPQLNNDEAPTSGNFSGGGEATFSPNNGPNRVNNIQINRQYIVKRAAGGETSIPGSPGNSNVNLDPTETLTQNGVNLSGLGIQVGDQICIRVTVRPTGGKIDTLGGIVLSNNTTSPSVDGCTPIAAKPYFKVYGGDVRAGGAFSSGSICGAVSPGSIKGWLKSDNRSGSGVQFAAMAISQINGFASASLRTSNPQPRDGLTFANTGSGTPGNFALSNCTTDFFGTTQFDNGDITKQGSVADGSSRDVVSLCGQSDKQSLFTMVNPTNRLVLTAAAPIGNCRHTIYVEGDVFIRDNLAYSSNGNATWATASDTPYFTLVAKGNIYISEQVTALDGLYIAQPRNATTGRIYTCRDQTTGSSINDASLYSRCSKRLVVRGAFVAQTIRLLRTFGSLRNSVPEELANGPDRAQNCDNSIIRPSSCAAELFDSTPELFIGSPVFAAIGGLRTGSFTSYTVLPPIL